MDGIALVTGAAQGIGRAVALAFAADGVRVAAVDRDAGGVSELAAGHDGIAAHPADVSSAAEVEAVVAAGLGAITVLVNVAGVRRAGPVLGYSDADRADTFAENATGLRDEEGLLRVGRDYRVRSGEGLRAGVYVQGDPAGRDGHVARVGELLDEHRELVAAEAAA
ncbi:SDR family NAD(P)-dependent oxidoreductase [Dactylosporangium sp. NPDC049140]|uniref:SDR family NAD(P)-dependent oxidoreductase n=1 Tax=Dactylosporangium sp. NPDC049140 TaxID=3155647 RepID=UPI0033D15F11